MRKILIVMGYLFAVFLFVLNVVVVLACLAQVIDGKSFGGVPFKTTDYVGIGLLVLWLWSLFAALVGLIRLLHIFGSLGWCRVLAAYLCLFIPFGTVFGLLTLIYLGKQKDWIPAA
jgi:hypothetical protein